MKLLFGTNNPHKLEEIRAIMPEGMEIVSLGDLGLDMDVEETETTFVGNAFLKARAFHKAAGIPCFADDSGLIIDALDGRPGVYSARYAGPGCTHEDNIQKVLGELGNDSKRSARFKAVIAYVDGETEENFDGVVEGSILMEKTGTGGFGYDPIFQPEGYDISFAQMDAKEKNRISHRGRSLEKFVAYLRG
ncbi:MAG: RdgB/HAM1 family non-canonical purine NTP pyrophosphatase [Bacteroidota bacterium]